MTTYYTHIPSPIGALMLLANEHALTGIYMQDDPHGRHEAKPDWVEDASRFRDAIRQLGEYFSGRRRKFDLRIEASGTPFQRSVWRALSEIPYGETISYGELARRIGNPKAMRAVGQANNRNPHALVVPCHRVIGADGSMTGYGGGIGRKEFLLALEASEGADTAGKAKPQARPAAHRAVQPAATGARRG